MILYQLLQSLTAFRGKKTGRVYHASPNALISAPAGEFGDGEDVKFLIIEALPQNNDKDGKHRANPTEGD
ncbi:MAG: hypothetical protein J0L94_01165 [Rhodothermia bacterium]|nr:hypothetical protein [Rhodothermia bacterium]